MKKLNKQGFTLIEVVVVMAIIAVLAVLVVGAITIARNTAKETANRSNAKTLQTCLEATYGSYKQYCGTDSGVTCGATNAKDLATDIGNCSIAKGSSDDATTGGVDVTVLSADNYTLKVKNHDNSGYIDSDITN